MTGATPSGGKHGGGSSRVTQDHGHGHEPRELWPRDFGRDGVSGLVTLDRALRSRDVSRPEESDEHDAAEVLDELLARIDGRRPRTPGGRRPH